MGISLNGYHFYVLYHIAAKAKLSSVSAVIRQCIEREARVYGITPEAYNEVADKTPYLRGYLTK